jgi:ribosomal protein S18 acetylase RimI-like enzyme
MHERILIRPATAADESVVELAVANGMFAAGEVDDLAGIFTAAVGGELDGHRWWMAVRTDGEVVGAAYVAPEPFADRVWNLYFIAVAPTGHGLGTGTRLVEHVEQHLRSAGEQAARVLVVETSSTEQYVAASAFYRARGFDEEARIRDFYGPGDDKVVFWKSLTD